MFVRVPGVAPGLKTILVQCIAVGGAGHHAGDTLHRIARPCFFDYRQRAQPAAWRQAGARLSIPRYMHLGHAAIELCGERMTVFAGILGYESFWLGAQGWVAVCSNLIPQMSARLFELVADHQDMDQALALYKKMLPIVKWVGGHRYVAASKDALEMMGLPVGKPRAPRLPLPAADAAELRGALDRLGLLNSIT